MISSIHSKLGTAGLIISIVALVAALGGGAYAASGGLSGKQKKEVEKIAKKYAGKPGANGAAGPVGPAGAPGAKGDAGTAGTNGTNGANGNDGTNGTTGFTSTLPSGQTETGAWSFTFNALNTEPTVAIPFTIPLAAPLGAGQVHLINADGSKEIIVNEEELEVEEVAPTKCGSALSPAGTAETPRAAAGNLCVYVTLLDPPVTGPAETTATGSNMIVDAAKECEAFGCLTELGGPGPGAGVAGARWNLASANQTWGYGTWAVTAP